MKLSEAGRQCTREDLVRYQQQRVEDDHKVDSSILLVYIGLLILSILTIWLFKHVRLRFIHETGLSILYGLIAGAIIRYATPPPTVASTSFPFLSNFTCPGWSPPDVVYVNVTLNERNHKPGENKTSVLYEYSLDKIAQSQDSASAMTHRATFDPEIFFNLLLPPIIFSAGYSMKRKHFFRNFGAIMIFAFFGTLLSTLIVGFICYGFSVLMGLEIMLNDCLLFGALISATDPVTVLAIFTDLRVDVDLNALVFGESVLNDAVAIVLSRAIEQYGSLTGGDLQARAVFSAIGIFAGVFFGSLAIGATIGCMTALMTKYTKLRDYPMLETALFFLMSYSTFLAAEAAGLTGIVAVLFCGIAQAHYTYNNLSELSQVWTKQLFEVTSFMAETFVFLYIGVSTFTFRQHSWNPGFIGIALLACVLARAAHIYPLSAMMNLCRSRNIPPPHQHMLLFSGLRGAMAFALAIRNTESDTRRLLFSTTLAIVIGTVAICGGLTIPVLQMLKIRVGVNSEETINIGSRGGQVQTNKTSRPINRGLLPGLWWRFDNRLLKPLLTHSGPLLTVSLPRCCYACATCLTTEEQYQHCTQRDVNEIEFTVDDRDLILPNDQVAASAATGSTAGSNRTVTVFDVGDISPVSRTSSERCVDSL